MAMERDSGISDASVESTENSEIAKFFDGKSVLITGGTGFLGSVLTESILRCCPGVHRVYIVIREKKGVSVESRKSAIFEKKLFQPLKNESPELLSKVQAVEGDITLTDLGIESSVLHELQDCVSVVFHCAAVISFSKTLRYTIERNSTGTENVVNLSRKFPNLVAFVHTSSAYSNSNREGEIEEDSYKLNVPARSFLDVVKSKSDDAILLAMQAKCTPPWPNVYTFSKAIAENFLNDEASDMPLAIVRPSIILNTWKGSSPGYIELGSGFIDISVGIGKGFIRVFRCDEKKNIDTVPVDIVANSLITTAWAIGTRKMATPLIVNVASSPFRPFTWKELITTFYKFGIENPLPKMYQKPYLVLRKNIVMYRASFLINHYIPAIIIDAILLVLRKKPKLTRLYRFYDVASTHLAYFNLNDWDFKVGNLRHLIKLQNLTDAELFPIDLTDFSIYNMGKAMVDGAPFYNWELDKMSPKARLSLAHRRYLLTSFIKWTTIFILFLFVAFIFTKIIF